MFIAADSKISASCFGALLQHGHQSGAAEDPAVNSAGLQIADFDYTKSKYILQPGLHVTVSALFPLCIPARQTV